MKVYIVAEFMNVQFRWLLGNYHFPTCGTSSKKLFTVPNGPIFSPLEAAFHPWSQYTSPPLRNSELYVAIIEQPIPFSHPHLALPLRYVPEQCVRKRKVSDVSSFRQRMHPWMMGRLLEMASIIIFLDCIIEVLVKMSYFGYVGLPTATTNISPKLLIISVKCMPGCHPTVLPDPE